MSSSRRLLLDAVAVLLLGAVVAGAALAFAWPWLPSPPAGGPLLARYAPLHDGNSSLMARYDPDGRVRGWESQNTAVITTGRAIAVDLRKAQREALEKFFRRADETTVPESDLVARVGDAVVSEVRRREVVGGGREVKNGLVSVSLREARGEFLLGLYDPEKDRDLVFDPPLQTFPAGLEPGATWETMGQFGVARYTYGGHVVEAGPFESRLGSFEDCLKIETRFVTANETQTIESLATSWLCTDVGLIEEHGFDAAGTLTSRVVVIGTDRFPAPLEALPPALGVAAAEPDEPPDPTEWRVSRLGRLGRVVAVQESTIAPVWIPGDPPALLVAGHEGDLVAYDAGDPTGSVLWRFHPGGTIYGAPAFDSAGGRVYFGASDKRLYALDSRGVFLWSFRTEDSVASRPLVVGDLVIFGSEDRNVYGLDATNGALRWTVSTGGPVVSAPALWGDPDSEQAIVVIGSDDGAAYGLDPRTGEQRWLYAADQPIEAPIVAAGNAIYVASRDGTVAALDPASGEAHWQARGGSAFRTAPIVSGDRVFAIDEGGYVVAFDREDGRRVWTSTEDVYIGPPLLVGDVLVVAASDGSVYRLGLDGTRVGQWSTAEATSPTDGAASFSFGPTLGGGAAWLVDRRAVVRRLGPSMVGAAPLRLAWIGLVGRDPFTTYLLTTTPVEYRGRALVLDTAATIHLLDPLTGHCVRVDAPESGGSNPRIDPTVAGDVLVTVVGDVLTGRSLPDGRTLWEFRGEGVGLRPPTIAGDTVLWLKQGEAEAPTGGKAGTLYALDLETGAPRWQQPLAGMVGPGGAVVRDGTVFISTPPAAFDIVSGAARWPGGPIWTGLGGPALDDATNMLFVGLADATGAGAVAALDVADGRVRWRTELGDDRLSAIEALWPLGGTVVVPTDGGKILGLDSADGALRWRYEPPAPRLAAVTAADGRVWFVLENGQVLGLDARTGELAARFGDLELNLNGVGLAQRPVLIGDRLLVPIGAGLLGLDVPGRPP